MFCPNCKTEFKDGIIYCPHCRTALVERLPGEEEEKQELDQEDVSGIEEQKSEKRRNDTYRASLLCKGILILAIAVTLFIWIMDFLF